MAIVTSQENAIDIKLNIGDKVTFSGEVVSFNQTEEGVTSIEIDNFGDIEITKNRKDALEPLRQAMDKAELDTTKSSRPPIPSVG